MMRLEEIFSSRGRVVVLRCVCECGGVHISEVSRRTGLSFTTVRRHLEELKDEGILEEISVGRSRFFRLSKSVTAERIRRFMLSFEDSRDHKM
ncbi:MAG: ArsR family transcriptional regulator [Thermoproteota archaeon]|nr:MAG: ArsR family transcriptional regulator [Candidatus Korarchaeota archaeon]